MKDDWERREGDWESPLTPAEQAMAERIFRLIRWAGEVKSVRPPDPALLTRAQPDGGGYDRALPATDLDTSTRTVVLTCAGGVWEVALASCEWSSNWTGVARGARLGEALDVANRLG